MLVGDQTAAAGLDEMPGSNALAARIQRQFHVERTGHGFDMVTIVCSRAIDRAWTFQERSKVQSGKIKPLRLIERWRFKHCHCKLLKLRIGRLPALEQCIDGSCRQLKAGLGHKLTKVIGVFANQEAGSV
ncbi:hypothetical protein D3C76_1417930 [compost metagenome]